MRHTLSHLRHLLVEQPPFYFFTLTDGLKEDLDETLSRLRLHAEAPSEYKLTFVPTGVESSFLPTQQFKLIAAKVKDTFTVGQEPAIELLVHCPLWYYPKATFRVSVKQDDHFSLQEESPSAFLTPHFLYNTKQHLDTLKKINSYLDRYV